MSSKRKPLTVKMRLNPTPTPRPSRLIQDRVNKINEDIQGKFRKRANLAHSDSEEDILLIDCDKVSVESISDSKDSFDSEDDEIIHTKDSALRKVQKESVRSWWQKNYSQKKGDSSKVVELTDGEDTEDFELILTKNKVESEMEPINLVLEKSKTKLKELKTFGESLKKQSIISCKSIREDMNSINNQVQLNKECFSKTNLNNLEQLSESQTIITKSSDFVSKFFCILCPEVCESSESAKTHYLCHLGVFLECGECHQKFSSVQSYRKHNVQHLDRNKMLHLDDFMNAKKWSDHYVDYIERHEELIQQFCRTNKMFCPVCRQIRQFYDNEIKSEKFEKSMKLDAEFVSNHLHQHFQYFPYECIDCRFDDKKTEFCLNRTARQHLLDVHNVENALNLKPNELKAYFDLKKSIKKLDICINYCLSLSTKMTDFWVKSGQRCDKQKIFVSKMS